jgi:hypothetical protein
MLRAIASNRAWNGCTLIGLLAGIERCWPRSHAWRKGTQSRQRGRGRIQSAQCGRRSPGPALCCFPLAWPCGAGDLYIAEVISGQVRKVTPDGAISPATARQQEALNSTRQRLHRGKGEPEDTLGVSKRRDHNRSWRYQRRRWRTGHPGISWSDRWRGHGTDGAIQRYGTGLPVSLTGSLGDGGPDTSGVLSGPSSVAVDAAGNLYIADAYLAEALNNRIRKVRPVEPSQPWRGTAPRTIPGTEVRPRAPD